MAESTYFFALEIVARKRGKAIGQHQLAATIGLEILTARILRNVTRQPRPTPSINRVSTEWSYMLANASFLARWRRYMATYHRCRRFSSSMKDESRSKYRSKETLERRDEVLQLFFVIFPWILLLEDIWSISTKNENKNYWKKVFDLILVIAFFFCEFLLNSLKFCGGKVTFSYGNEARIGR